MTRLPYFAVSRFSLALAGLTILSTPAFAHSNPQAEIAALKAQIQKESDKIRQLMDKVDQLQAHQNKDTSKAEGLQKKQTTEAQPPSKAESSVTGVHDWSGPYAGVSIGAGVTSGITEFKDCNGCSSDSFADGLVQGGFHAGYNYQIHNTVLGIESEVALGSQNHNEYLGQASSNQLYLTHSEIDWTAAILGRAGIAVGDSLFFVVAGPAIAHLKGSAISQQDASQYFTNTWAPGIKGGVGAELFVAPNISVRAQYSLLNVSESMASVSPASACPVGNVHCRVGWTGMQHTASIGADWHF